MESVKADIIEYIADNEEKFSLNISEMLSAEMIAKINVLGREELTLDETHKLNEVFVWFNNIQCSIHGVRCTKLIENNNCNIEIFFDNEELMERFNFRCEDATYNLRNILTKMNILGMCKVEYIELKVDYKVKVIEYHFDIGIYTLNLMELSNGKIKIRLMLPTNIHDRRVKRIVGYLSGSKWR